MQVPCCCICCAPACVCHAQGLEFVSLQNVGCSVHACNALSELVPNGSALAGLHLYNNMTGDEGAEHVARLLSRCPGMADFKLASSRVGASGGISIAKALSVGEQDPCLVLPAHAAMHMVRPGGDACF